MPALAERGLSTLIIAVDELEPDVFIVENFIFPDDIDIRSIIEHCHDLHMSVIGTWEYLQEDQAYGITNHLSVSAYAPYATLRKNLREGIDELLQEYAEL